MGCALPGKKRTGAILFFRARNKGVPNHRHLVLWPDREGDLVVFMQRLTVTQVTRWQKNRRRVGEGHVYQGRFKSFLVETDEYFYNSLGTLSGTRYARICFACGRLAVVTSKATRGWDRRAAETVGGMAIALSAEMAVISAQRLNRSGVGIATPMRSTRTTIGIRSLDPRDRQATEPRINSPPPSATKKTRLIQ